MPRVRLLVTFCAVALGSTWASGCATIHPARLTESRAQSIRDSVIALEDATNTAVDRLDCPSAFTNIADQPPVFVSSGRVSRTRSAFRAACDALVAPRTGAVFATDTVSAHVLASDAVYVVREGVYTINMKDGTTRRIYLIMTSIWARRNGAWQMVHLHESSKPMVP